MFISKKIDKSRKFVARVFDSWLETVLGLGGKGGGGFRSIQKIWEKDFSFFTFIKVQVLVTKMPEHLVCVLRVLRCPSSLFQTAPFSLFLS